MGANCASSALPCCSPLACIGGRVCGMGAGAGTDAGIILPLDTFDAGPPVNDPGPCSGIGDSCVVSECCSGLVCVADRVCGEPVPDAGQPPPGGGFSTDGGAEAGPLPGACANGLSRCDTMPCCPGLECVTGDFGMTCFDPSAMGGTS